MPAPNHTMRGFGPRQQSQGGPATVRSTRDVVRCLAVPALMAVVWAVVCAVAWAGAAVAQSTFHLKEFDYQVGTWEFESINAYQDRLGPLTNRVRTGHELGLAYTFTSRWQPKILIGFDTDDGQDLKLQRLLFENVFTLKPLALGPDGIGLGWFQSIEGALNDRQTNVTLFGPIVTAQWGRFSFSTNTFLEKTFGQNREPGLNLQYALQTRYLVMDKVKVGFEVYGMIPEFGTGGARLSGLENRVGPVLIIDFDLPRDGGAGVDSADRGTSRRGPARSVVTGSPGPAHAELELGVLFGTTDYTADVSGKANMHVRF